MKLHRQVGLDDIEMMNFTLKTLTGAVDFSEKEELFLCSFTVNEYFTATHMPFRDLLTPFMTSISEKFMNNERSVDMAKEAMQDKNFKELLMRIGVRIINERYRLEKEKEVSWN